jgi:hypothetical protein
LGWWCKQKAPLFTIDALVGGIVAALVRNGVFRVHHSSRYQWGISDDGFITIGTKGNVELGVFFSLIKRISRPTSTSFDLS